MRLTITKVFDYWVKGTLPNGREVKLPRACFFIEPKVGEAYTVYAELGLR